MGYRDFVLTFSELESNDYQVKAESDGFQTEVRTLPFDRLDASSWKALTGNFVIPASPDSARETGDLLYRALFSGKIGKFFSQRLGGAEDNGGLRLIFRFDAERQEKLLRLPWETLFRKESKSFLALSPRTPILRQIEIPEHRAPTVCNDDLHILIATSDAGGTPLQLAREVREIEAIFADDPRVTVETVRPHNVQELREALQQSEAHILHYMGHGDYRLWNGEGHLYVGETAVTGNELAQQLHDVDSLRLIFLNACHSARDAQTPQIDPFAGVATALLRSGFPSVLAMNRAITDSAAIAFSRKFYKRLAAGDDLPSAVSEGRLAICETDRHSVQWSTPVLFANHADARLLSGPWSPTRPGWETLFQPPRIYAVASGTVLCLALLASCLGLRPETNSPTTPEGEVSSSEFPMPPREPRLILTEVFYDPSGDDRGLEWIELYNATDEPIDLAGYSIGAGGKDYTTSRYQLAGVIGPGETFVVGGPISVDKNYRPQFQLALDLLGEIQNADSTPADGVALFDVPASEIKIDTLPIDAVRYGDENSSGLPDERGDTENVEVSDAPRDTSIERFTLDGRWRITSIPGPNRVRFEDPDPEN
ncbi:MAG: CHAT domain-containing protein [Acidobacteriota bacterium]